MLIRICLIAAVVLSLAVAVLNFVTVKEKITTTIKERNDFHTERDAEALAKTKALKLAKDTQTTLDKTKAELVNTTDERDKAVADAASQNKRANDLADNLKKTQTTLDSAQNELAAWHALGPKITEIKATLASLKTITEERDAMADERRILTRARDNLQAKLDSIIHPEIEPPMTPGLKGKVLVTDPKYDFVVLDVGENQGVVPNGRFLVNRNGKLIAKVRVMSMESNRCIANVMPGWKISEVMEGDQVLY
jgi:hypothetical protein